jgi:hypothetical protein
MFIVFPLKEAYFSAYSLPATNSLRNPWVQALQERLTTHLADAEGLGDGRNDQGGITDRSQIDEREAIGEQVAHLCCYLQSQARLPRAAGARQRQQAYIFTMQELRDGCDFLLPSDERRGLNGQIVGMGTAGPERWKIDGQARDHQLEEMTGTL